MHHGRRAHIALAAKCDPFHSFIVNNLYHAFSMAALALSSAQRSMPAAPKLWQYALMSNTHTRTLDLIHAIVQMCERASANVRLSGSLSPKIIIYYFWRESRRIIIKVEILHDSDQRCIDAKLASTPFPLSGDVSGKHTERARVSVRVSKDRRSIISKTNYPIFINFTFSMVFATSIVMPLIAQGRWCDIQR